MEFSIKKNKSDARKHVVARPSDKEGLFVFKSSYHGIVAVGELALRDFPGEVQRDIDKDDLSSIGSVVHVGYDDDRFIRFNDVTATAIILYRGSNNSLNHAVKGVFEMAPVVPEISKSAVQPTSQSNL